MILSDIRRYLEQRGQATLADIARHFDADPGAVQGMLGQWVRKGRVRRHLASSACGSSCSKCDPGEVEVYEWICAARSSEDRVVVFRPPGCGD